MVRGVLFNWDFELDFDMIVKSVRQTISILAWTWALFIFFLSYFGQGGGDYNHVNNDMEDVPIHPAPLFSSVFVPILRVWVGSNQFKKSLTLNSSSQVIKSIVYLCMQFPMQVEISGENDTQKNKLIIYSHRQLLLVASTLGQTEKKNKALSDETPPGSAGHHGSVQSGQFLLTNNENYGLQISHTPYSSNPAEEEQLPKAQKLRQQQYQNAVPAGGETFCAGCTSLSNPQQDEQYYNNNAQQPQNAYAVPVQQKQQRYQRPQQVPYSTGHNSNIGNNAIQQQQPGYSYSVNLEGPSGGQRDSSWGWNSWNQQQQPQAQVRASQPMQQYQWGQRNPPNQQKQQVRSGWVPPQQHQQYHRELTAPAVQQHLRINDDGQYR